MNMSRPQSGNTQLIGLVAVVVVLLVALGVVFLGGNQEEPVTPQDDTPEEVTQVDAGTLEGQPAQVERNPDVGGPNREEVSAPTMIDDFGDTIGGMVSGMVVDDQGNAIAGATVAVSQRFSAGVQIRGYNDDERFTANTDSSGRYRLRELAAGIDMNMWVYADGYAPTQAPPFQALESEGQELPPVVLKGGYSVTGTVKDEGGNPLQATVVMSMQPRDAFRGGAPDEQAADDRALGREVEVMCDDEGAFVFNNLADGIWILRADHEGFAREEVRPLMLMQGQAVEPQFLTLGDEHIISGVVLNDQRMPVADALVSVARTQPRPVMSDYTRTREDGTFDVTGLQDGIYGLSVQAEGYTNGRSGRLEANTQGLEIILQQKANVSGRVTGPQGAVADFSLEVFRTRRGNPTYGMTGTTFEFSGTDGTYVLENLDPGSYILLARSRGMAPTWSSSFMLQREDVSGIDVMMQAGARIEGRVIDADGKPLANTTLSLHGNDYDPDQIDSLFGAALNDPNNVPKLEVRSGPDGRFVMENAYLGSVQLFIQHQTHMPTLLPLDLQEGQVAQTGDIELYRGATIYGTVLGADGKALAGGTVNLGRKDGANFFNRTMTVDARGRYRFDGLRAGTYEIVAFPPANENVFLFPAEGDKQSVYVQEGEEKEVELKSTV
jgi:hypothetical protein